MAYTALSAAASGQLINAAWMNLYLRDNLNAINGGGGKVPALAIAWWGDGATRPDNWFLCDGTFGVLDLRDRIVIGAGSAYAVADAGGALSQALAAHTAHVLTAPDHSNHTLTASPHPSHLASTKGASGATIVGLDESHGGSSSGAVSHSGQALTDTHAHVNIDITPPYLVRTPILKGNATVSFVAPRTWADGDVPTAAMFNADLRDNFRALRQTMLWPTAILLWSGSLAAVPAGYQLCDGTNGTPDLRDRFIYASSSLAINATGGSFTHSISNHANHVPSQASDHGTHSISLASHSTNAVAISGPGSDLSQFFLDHSNVSISAGHSSHSGFSVDAHTAHADIVSAPPAIALGYIQLVSAGTYTEPRTWTDGELVDASRINTYLRDNQSALYSSQVPIGAILVWHNSIASIPSGYALCNGSGGTPDTRDRFVLGAGLTYATGSTTGAASSTPAAHSAHVVNSPGQHSNHSMTNGSHAPSQAYAAGLSTELVWDGFTHNFATDVGVHAHTWSVDAHSAHAAVSLLPPYIALAFMQRVS